MPDLRIVDDGLWQAVKARQASVLVQYANAVEGARAANSLNAMRRPKSLLSGLVTCGVCGGPMSLRGQGRYACAAHVDHRSSDNAHTITRSALETRVLDGLRDRLMSPEIAAEAVRAYVEEANRLNQQQRAASASDKAELAKVLKAIDRLVTMATEGHGTRVVADKLLALEAQEDAIRARMSAAPLDPPDVHPNIAGIYHEKVERLAEALQHPQERDETADAIRAASSSA